MPAPLTAAATYITAAITAAKDKKPKPTPTPTPDPSSSVDPSQTPNIDPTDSGGDTFGAILQFIITYPWIPGLLIAFIAAQYGWKKLTFRKNLAGQPFPPLSNVIKRALRVMYIEDKTPAINKPQKLAAKTTWLTWQRYWLTVTAIAAINASRILTNLAPEIDYTLLAINLVLAFAGYRHLRTVFAIRHRMLMQMYEVAASEMRYLKGAELNPWAYIQISKWRDLYSPDTTNIMYPPRYRSEDPRNREAFEMNFNGTVSDAHTWTYTWESANNRVIAEPVPHLPARADYRFPDEHEWNEFPLGLGPGSKEVIWDVTTFPHMLIAGTTGSGKAVERSTKIPTPSGWTTMGDIKVGDEVFDENGKPCTVTWVSDINEQPDLFEVVFSDGSVIRADAEHLWFTETRQVRESRWNAKKKPVERRLLISQERQEVLRGLAESATDDDDITLPALAEHAGVAQESPWLREVADRLGPVGEVQVVKEFHYAEQTVTQKQKARIYPARQAWTGLLSRAEGSSAARWSVVSQRREVIAALAEAAGPSDEVTASEVAQTLGLPKATAAGDLLKVAKVPCVVEQREVQLQVPAKTVRRKGPWVRTYNTKAIIAALLERVQTPAHDQRHKNNYGSVKTTGDIIDTLTAPGGQRNHAIPVAKPLDLPEADLPIEPYVLGAWLGDGMSRKGAFCGIDHEVAKFANDAGYDTEARTVSPSATEHPDFRIWVSKRLHRELSALNLLQRTTPEGTRKHIPAVYLRASIGQRRALLAGLLDTDGTVAPQGTVQFTSIHESLARQVRELALSLGYRAAIISSVKRAQTGAEVLAWTVSWTCPESPFRLTRKTEAHRERNVNYSPERNETRFITEVRRVEPVPARCIAVDSPSRLFLAGESMIPTHNSVTQRTILMHALQQKDMRVLLIDPKRVELSGYASHPHVLKIATELDESLEMLEQVEQEMQSRYLQMKDAGCNHFKSMPEPPPALLLMIDETFALLSPENVKSDEGKERDEMHARATVLIGSIARLGRAAGIHMVLATQRPDAKVIPGETRALALDTPILTVDGWKTVEGVVEGDTVFDERGRQATVTGVTEVMYGHDCYEVVFSDGERIVADAGHLWSSHDATFRMAHTRARRRVRESLVARPSRGPAVVTTRQMSESLMYHGKKNHAIPVLPCALELPERDLPLSPYVLGVWLGDGNRCATTFTSEDEPIVEAVRAEGFDVWVADPHDRANNWRFVEAGTSPNRWRPGVKGVLRDLNLLQNKHIPDMYMLASASQRQALLEGLMDTDGHNVQRVNRSGTRPVSRVCFTSCDEGLARQVVALVRSLGYRPTLTSAKSMKFGSVSEPTGETTWRVMWTPHAPVFRLPRKVEGQHLSGHADWSPRTDYRYVVAVNPVPSVPVKCIAVDAPSRLFLAGEALIPTHNSNLDARIAQGRMDTTPSLMTLDSDAATRLPAIKGRAVFRSGNDTTEFQAYFLPNEYFNQVLEMSAALATGSFKVEDFKIDPSQDGSKKRSFRLPLPRKLAGWLSSWVQRRQQVVERNDAESKRFAAERHRKRERKQARAVEAARSGSDVDAVLEEGFVPPEVDRGAVSRGSRGRRGPRPGDVTPGGGMPDVPVARDGGRPVSVPEEFLDLDDDEEEEFLPDAVLPPPVSGSSTRKGRAGRPDPEVPRAPVVPVAAVPGSVPVDVPVPDVDPFEEVDLFDEDDDADVEEAPWMPSGPVGSAGSVFGAGSERPAEPESESESDFDSGSGAESGPRSRGRGVIPPPPPE